MLEFSDLPYKFYPARPSRLMIRVGQFCNKRFILPGGQHRIRSVEVSGRDRLQSLIKDPEARLLYLPNHPTHSDAQVLFETHRQLGTMSYFMTAYDVMERNAWLRWLMQRGGCFSINRDGSDSTAMKFAIDILKEGGFDLTIFPEGNVFLMNDLVTPYQAGAAFIAMKAQKELGRAGSLYLVPVSVKATYLSDVRRTALTVLGKVASDSGTETAEDEDPVKGIQRIGISALANALQHRGIVLGDRQGQDISELIEESAGLMITQLETKMTLEQGKSLSLYDRIKKIRERVHEIRTDPDQSAMGRVAATWADEAITALRILSYTGKYLGDVPSLDRYCETVEKLHEDIYNRTLPPMGDRHVYVLINQPINLAERLPDFRAGPKKCVTELTSEVESRVQAGLDEINAANVLHGSEPFQA